MSDYVCLYCGESLDVDHLDGYLAHLESEHPGEDDDIIALGSPDEPWSEAEIEQLLDR